MSRYKHCRLLITFLLTFKSFKFGIEKAESALKRKVELIELVLMLDQL